MDAPQLGWTTDFVWGIADDVLRDPYVRGKYRDVILPTTVLRRLDTVLAPTKQAVLDMKASLDRAGITNQDQALRQAAGPAFCRSPTRRSSPSPTSTSTAASRSPRRLSTASRPTRSPSASSRTPYRFLVCADKFQTGYDEPLLHTMYVDKVLSGVKAVQTLSRLNRAHPLKHDVFVLDFMDDTDTIEAAFADYCRTTVLSEETDPDKLHDLKAELDGAQVYAQEQVDDLVELYLTGADRDRLDPILDACVATYKEHLDDDGQVDFKGKAKSWMPSTWTATGPRSRL